MAVESRRNRT